MKSFNGKVLFLDRSDINTDEIIPAKYLTEITKDALKPYLLEDLKLASFNPARDIQDKSAIITRNNFGCGSSREHAPWALEVNNINLVIAVNFARIFRQNMYNCGMMALELSADTIDQLFKNFANEETEVTTDLAGKTLTFRSKNKQEKFPFSIGDFDANLIKAGGWVEYAANHY